MGAQQSTPEDMNLDGSRRDRVESIFSAPSLDLDRFCFSTDCNDTPMLQAIYSELDQITPIAGSDHIAIDKELSKSDYSMAHLKTDTSPEVKMAIETRKMTRTVRRLRRLSVACIENTSLVKDLTMSSLSEIFSFCDDLTKTTIHDSCEYFAKLIDTSRQVLDLYTDDSDWLELLRVSPYLKKLTIHGEISSDDILSFTSLIKFNCLPDLNSIVLDQVGEVAIIDILKSIEVKLAYLQSKRNSILANGLSDKELSICIDTASLRKLTAKSVAESLNGSLKFVLVNLTIRTLDGAGLIELFRDLELYQYSNLKEIKLSQCNLCRKSFEMFIRSLWPEYIDPLNFPPITKLYLEECGLNDNCIDALVRALNRGAGVNLDTLDLSSNRISRNGIKILSQPFQNYQLPNLKCFYISNNWSGNGGLSHILDTLKEGVSPNLQELEIDRMGLGTKDITSLNEYILSPFFSQMYRLNLRNNPDIIYNLATFFNNLAISNNRSLSILFLENTSLGDNEIHKMVKWFNTGNVQSLKYLFLKGNTITGLGFKLLLDCLIKPNTPNLKVLDVSSNNISNIFIETDEYINEIDHQSANKPSSYELNRSFEQITGSPLLNFPAINNDSSSSLSSSCLSSTYINGDTNENNSNTNQCTSPSQLAINSVNSVSPEINSKLNLLSSIITDNFSGSQLYNSRASVIMDVIDSDSETESNTTPVIPSENHKIISETTSKSLLTNESKQTMSVHNETNNSPLCLYTTQSSVESHNDIIPLTGLTPVTDSDDDLHHTNTQSPIEIANTTITCSTEDSVVEDGLEHSNIHSIHSNNSNSNSNNDNNNDHSDDNNSNDNNNNNNDNDNNDNGDNSNDNNDDNNDNNNDNNDDIIGRQDSSFLHEHVGSPKQPIHQFSGEFYHTSARVDKKHVLVSSYSSENKRNEDSKSMSLSSNDSLSSVSNEYRKNWNLIQLELSYNPFTDRDIIGLFDILKKHCNLEFLEDLGFDEGKFTSIGFQTIFESLTIDCNSALNRVDIFSGSGTNSGSSIRHFLESRFANSMSILQLRDCHLSKQDCYEILRAFETDKRPQRITRLFLTGNPEFCDDHIYYILKLLKQNKFPITLTGINVSYTSVTRAGLEALFDYYSTYPDVYLKKFILEGLNMHSDERHKYQEKFEQYTNCKLIL